MSGYAPVLMLLVGMHLTNKKSSHANAMSFNGAMTVADSSQGTIGAPLQSVEFKRWVLFLRDADRGSMEALKQVVAIENECLIKDVDAMSDRPEWLQGVPTLLDVVAKRKYEGSAAIQHLKSVVASEPLGYANVKQDYYTFGDDEAWGGPARATDYILPSVARDERYEATQPLSSKDIDSYIALRESTMGEAHKAIEHQPKALTYDSGVKKILLD